MSNRILLRRDFRIVVAIIHSFIFLFIHSCSGYNIDRGVLKDLSLLVLTSYCFTTLLKHETNTSRKNKKGRWSATV